MNKSNLNYFFSIFCITILLTSVFASSSSSSFIIPIADARVLDKKYITVASWNLQNFAAGLDKWKLNDAVALQAITDVITSAGYDVIFIQELQNKTTSSIQTFDGFNKLCTQYLFPVGYLCQNTPVINGVGSNNEGYGVIYEKSLGLAPVLVEDTRSNGTNPIIPQGQSAGKMARPPMKATLDLGYGTNMIVFSNHDNPNNVPRELQVFESAITNSNPNLKNERNVVVLGDLNADCTYYTPGHPGQAHVEFAEAKGWHWVIPNDRTYKTNFAKTPCVYDRIIINDNTDASFYNGVSGFGVVGTIPVKVGTIPAGTEFGDRVWGPSKNKQLSDHRLVWASFNFGGIDPVDVTGHITRDFMDYINPPKCNIPDTIYTKGEGFVPNKQVDIYITEFPTNGNKNGAFKNSTLYTLTDVRGTHNSTITNTLGNIPVTSLWTAPDPKTIPGGYNIIIDVNRDGKFRNSVDVVDLFDMAGFGVDKCDTTGAPPAKKMRASAERTFGADRDDRVFVDPQEIYISLTEFEPNSVATFYKTVYDKNYDYTGKIPKKLPSGEGIPATFDESGSYKVDIIELPQGNYDFIVDVNKDGYYTYGIDAVHHLNEIGFVVIDSYPIHSNIVDLDDNANQREDYNADIAKNVYVLAHNLPVQDRNVDLYVISERLLRVNNPGWTTWDVASNVDLKESEAPVYNKKATHSVWTSSQKSIFASVWNEPSRIYDSDYINYFGKKYVIVIDVNQDGKYNSSDGDMVDTHDIGDMTKWFITQGHHDLSPTSGSGKTPAVSEYKEYLNSKLDLEHPLDHTNTYDSATENASLQYSCHKDLPITMFHTLIQPGSQTGFIMFNSDEYYAGRDLESGRHLYDQVEFDSLEIGDGQNVVLVSNGGDKSTLDMTNLSIGKESTLHTCNVDTVKIDGMNTKENSKSVITADKSIHIDGKITNHEQSTTCLNVLKTVATGAAFLFGAAVLEFFTVGTATPFIIGLGLSTAAAASAACI